MFRGWEQRFRFDRKFCLRAVLVMQGNLAFVFCLISHVFSLLPSGLFGLSGLFSLFGAQDFSRF
jgi:hypothetical protein